MSSSGDRSFAGAISSHNGISLFDSITAKKNVNVGGNATANKLFASSLQVDEAKSAKDVRVDGILNLTLGLGVKGSVHTTSLIVSESIESTMLELINLVVTKRLSVATDIVVEGKVSTASSFHTKDGSMLQKISSLIV